MKQGILFYDDEIGRYNFHYIEGGVEMDYEGIHCGELFQIHINNVWITARIEMDTNDQWYLVGLPGLKLDGLEVRKV